MRHVLDTYSDCHVVIEFCKNCGKEGLDLFEACQPKFLNCQDCGQTITIQSCIYCERIKEKFRMAVDKQNDRL